MKNTLIVIPTYNEADNIEAIICETLSINRDYHALVVDDSSPDGTGDLVANLFEQFPNRLFLETRPQKEGLGRAYLHAFRWALAADYKFIFEMDADFSHDPKDLPRLLAACRDQGADVAIGSRYVTGVNVVNWPMSRVLLSFFASKYVQFITGMKIHDTTAGFKCYRRAVLESMNFSAIRFVGYAFQIEMKFRAWRKGFRIVEVPVIFTDRTLGQSKMSRGIIREAVFGVIALKVSSWFTKS